MRTMTLDDRQQIEERVIDDDRVYTVIAERIDYILEQNPELAERINLTEDEFIQFKIQIPLIIGD